MLPVTVCQSSDFPLVVSLIGHSSVYCLCIYLMENIARQPLGPPPLPVFLPRTFGNPASIIDAPLVDISEINEIRQLAKENAVLVHEMTTQEKDDLIAHFSQA
ncbi:unnamed protein product [Schistosoma turkestanicum]|nr:unnamed protein product [Schistosoma turkestanicum]